MNKQLPKEQFEKMRVQIEQEDAQRDELIKQSRDLQKDAKHAVYLAHQGKVADAAALVSSLATRHATIRKTFAHYGSVGAYNACVEEYSEAAIFVAYCQEKTVPTIDDLQVTAEQYLGGLSDATGELGRRAVFAATDGDVEAVKQIRSFVDAVQGELLQFHLRNGTLRKKYDAVKYNLKKVEEILYDVTVRSRNP